MTAFEPYGRLPAELPDLLHEIAAPRLPDYTDEALAVTAGIRQRPRWTFPERYLPMIITRQRLMLPTVPWRPILVVLAILALITAALFVAGQRRVPPPFGPARNGAVVYDRDGDIYIRDTLDGAERLLVGGAGNDIAPGFTRDGRRLTFLRLTGSEESGSIDVIAVNSDGSNLTTIATGLIAPNWGDLSPDDSTFVFHAVDPSLLNVGNDDRRSRLWVLDLNHPTAPKQIELPLAWETVPSFRGPDGREIVFRGARSEYGVEKTGVFSVHLDGTGLTPLTPTDGKGTDDYQQPLLSPDGRYLTYTSWAPGLQLHLRDLTTGDDRILTLPGLDEGYATFSPDGSRIVFIRYTGGAGQAFVLPIAPGSKPIAAGPAYRLVEGEYISTSFSPDGKWVIVSNPATKETRLVDAATGGMGEVISGPPSGFSWQRLAP